MPTELRFNRNYIIYYHNWTMITLTGRQKQELKVVGILIKALYYTTGRASKSSIGWVDICLLGNFDMLADLLQQILKGLKNNFQFF